jgi:uncharacterized protein YeaO (DUF488 family)
LPKKKETWDAWWKELGPSEALHADAYGKRGRDIEWSEYRERYLEEMKAHTEPIRKLAEKVAAGERVTLLCSSSCTDESRCHRTLLRALIEAEAAKLANS